MNGLSHKQAKRYMQADLDGLLSDAQRFDLERHLSGCETCRAEFEALSTLTLRLQSEFHEWWDLRQDGPSQNVVTNVRSQTRRIAMSNKIKFGLRALGGVALLVILGFTVNFVVSQLRDHSTAANGTTVPDDTNMPVSLPDAGDPLIAFASAADDGNLDIYTAHADGSGLTNLTKNPAHDVNPFWSPDGKRIAFTSDWDGFMNLYVMNADGSELTQLTNNDQPTANAHHELGVNDQSPWSPDGSKLLFTEWSPDTETWELYFIGVDGQNKTLLTHLTQAYSYPSWVPDGGHVAYIVPESIGGREMARIHVVEINGKNDTNVTALLPEDENLDSWNSTSWTPEGNIRFVAGRVYAENGNTKFAVYEASPDGKTLIELTKTSTPLEDWWEGTAFVRGFSAETLTWLRADGTYSEFKPYETARWV